MNLKITALLISLTLGILPTIGQAATCTRPDFTGFWKIYSFFNPAPGRCTIIMPSTGTTISTNSTCYLPGQASSIPIRGTLTLSTDCRVTGTITIGTERRTVEAYISKGKDSISGMVWSASPLDGDDFSGVKQ